MGIALNVSTWYVPRGSRTYETFCFLLARQTGEGGAKCLPHSKATLLLFESLQTKAERNSQNRLRVPNMLKRHHHHHYHRHRHHHLSSIWLLLYNFPSKNKQNGFGNIYDTTLHNCDANVCSKQHFPEITNFCSQDDPIPWGCV